MKIKIGDDYLEYEGDIEIEKKIKLFEDIEATEGDFSYQFEVFLTAKNIRLLGIPFADNSSKPVYNNIDCQLLGEDGLMLYSGYLRIEGIKNDIARLSFFSGNNTWFSMITGNLSDLDYSGYDVEITRPNITTTWNNDDGIIFPLLDTGALSERSTNDTVVEDFIPFLFLKKVVLDIFQSVGIKIKGELLNDYRYNNLLISSNENAKTAIDDRSSFVLKNVSQNFAVGTTQITFQDDSNPPYFDGANDNFSLVTNRYTADSKMFVLVSVSIEKTAGTAGTTFRLTAQKKDGGGVNAGGFFGEYDNEDTSITYSRAFYIPSGYTIQLDVTLFSGIAVDITRATFKITPITIYKSFGNSILPNWSKQKLVSDVLRIFNTITEYNPQTSELTINLFEKIKDKTPVDLSEYISEVDVDYVEFINDYGRKNNLIYQSPGIEILDVDENLIASEEDYNKASNTPYGGGTLIVDNDFIEETVDIIESDFSAPFSYINGVFDMSLDRLDFVEHKVNPGAGTEFSIPITSVTDSSGLARFDTTSSLNLEVGHLVKIEDSTVAAYNGIWLIYFVDNTIPNFFLVQEVVFQGNATAKATKVDVVRTSSDSTYLVLKSPFVDVTTYLSSKDFRLSDSTLSATQASVSQGYFDLLNNGRDAFNKWRLGMSFGRSTNVLQFQVPLIESYWDLVGRILNDPVKLICTANIPEKVFRNISFLNPVIIRTKETSNMYYLNRITGYKGSHLPCTLELIKLP